MTNITNEITTEIRKKFDNNDLSGSFEVEINGVTIQADVRITVESILTKGDRVQPDTSTSEITDLDVRLYAYDDCNNPIESDYFVDEDEIINQLEN